jgi:BirA family biotin operon repressor/biotin-[acetyl-CoA-carboxylase] ligase
MAAFAREVFEVERARLGLTLGAPLVWREQTASTSDDATAAAQSGAAHGALFGAETQTRGRGRRGSEWLSEPGAGLWFSLLLRPRFGPELLPGVALAAGLAVRQAVAARLTVSVQVKWPNDVLADNRKIAGILAESQLAGARISSVIVGIGINVTQREFPAPIREIATSLAQLSARDKSRELLLASVLCELEAELERLTSGGLGAVADALAAHDALLGRRLRVDAREGRGAGIDPSGRLRLRALDGAEQLIASGHVELLGDG